MDEDIYGTTTVPYGTTASEKVKKNQEGQCACGKKSFVGGRTPALPWHIHKCTLAIQQESTHSHVSLVAHLGGLWRKWINDYTDLNKIIFLPHHVVWLMMMMFFFFIHSITSIFSHSSIVCSPSGRFCLPGEDQTEMKQAGPFILLRRLTTRRTVSREPVQSDFGTERVDWDECICASSGSRRSQRKAEGPPNKNEQ